MEWSLFLESEETIHNAEINDTSYEPPSCFSLGKNNQKLKIKIKMADSKKIITSSDNSQYFFMNISCIGPWVIRIDWLMQRALMWLNLYGNDLSLSRTFWFFFKFFFIIFFPMKNNLAVHIRYYLFLHYGWFLQNLGEDFIPSIMHMTVSKI